MEFSFEATVVLTLEHKKGYVFSRHVSTDFNLDVSENLNKKEYLNEKDLPTEKGSQVLTNVLIQGLIGNIHMAHQKGYRDSAEHLRFIIAELERGFLQVANVEESNF